VGQLQDVLHPFVLIRGPNVVYKNPPRRSAKVVWVPTTPWQDVIYNWVLGKNPGEYAGLHGQSGVQNYFIQLSKVMSHPHMLTHDGFKPSLDMIRYSGKFECLDRIMPKLLRFGHRTIILCQSKTTMNYIQVYLRQRKQKFARFFPDWSNWEIARQQRKFLIGRRPAAQGGTGRGACLQRRLGQRTVCGLRRRALGGSLARRQSFANAHPHGPERLVPPVRGHGHHLRVGLHAHRRDRRHGERLALRAPATHEDPPLGVPVQRGGGDPLTLPRPC